MKDVLRSISLFALAVPALGFVRPAAAQWSSDPNINLVVADGASDQVQAKVRATSDGGCYISWYNGIGNGYDVRLQRLNAQGVEQWAHNGILVANTSFSSTQDYGLAVDPANNAIIAFRDDRSGAVQITVNKIDPAGTLLWGTNGVQVSVTPGAGNNPKIGATSDGNYVAGWSEGSSFKLQRLDGTGAAQWTAGGVTFTPATGMYGVSEIMGSDNGSVIVLWIRYVTTFMSNKHLYTQKYDASGAPQWNTGNPVIVFDANSIQNGYFPTLLSDGAGGGVYGWYETGGPRNVYAQHVSAAGAELFPHNGSAVSTLVSGRIRLSPAIAYNSTTSEVFEFWTESNTLQSMWGVSGQKFNSTGIRQWTDTAHDYIALNPQQNAFIRTVTSGTGAMAFWFDQPGSAAHVVGVGADGSGALTWPGTGFIEPCSVASSKSRLDVALNSSGKALLAWGDGRTDSGDIYAQNVNPDGTLGNIPVRGDITGDGHVNVDDLLAVINSWGNCPNCKLIPCPADVAPRGGDCVVNVDDLLMVINNWG